ncbi:hypothetical protein HYPSUDRAFT_210480 [Hypholoma sublateritium FD-334 SS-4]|uniref:Uncharacterized protein n=1 Tax=Hypholoma sublateritium (strain FD-334 SS-4) TaxID=945553 RepID=A0A0D2LN84_HYPSF|nr:hypothetical protein HYPSUDRAFT_210480 [Hypholoma sublateritium FD-334 SS-4]
MGASERPLITDRVKRIDAAFSFNAEPRPNHTMVLRPRSYAQANQCEFQNFSNTNFDIAPRKLYLARGIYGFYWRRAKSPLPPVAWHPQNIRNAHGRERTSNQSRPDMIAQTARLRRLVWAEKEDEQTPSAQKPGYDASGAPPRISAAAGDPRTHPRLLHR